MPYSKDHKAKSKMLILESAIELFSRYGFEKVSIGQIMSSAKMTHGAFYSHFESKEALFKESFLNTLKQSRAARLVKGPLSIKHLKTLVTDYWSLAEMVKERNPGPEIILFNEAGSDNIKIKHLFEESYNNVKKMIETRLIALSKLKQHSFEKNSDVIAEKSRAILTSLVGAVIVAKNISNEDERRKILEAAQNQILTMLGVNEPNSSAG